MEGVFGQRSSIVSLGQLFGGTKMKHFFLLMALPLVMALPVIATAQDATDRTNYYFDKDLVEEWQKKRPLLSVKLKKMLRDSLNRQECDKPCLVMVSISTQVANNFKDGSRGATDAIRREVLDQVSRDQGMIYCGACGGFQVPFTGS